ncbi:hypothetical protein [Nautilia sp.]
MKAFTLIEVIIAVMLSFIISSAVFSVISEGEKILSLAKTRGEFSYRASVGVLEKDAKNVYEMLKGFGIKNDKIIKELKKEKLYVKYNTEYSEKIDSVNTLVLKKIKIYDKTSSVYVYSAEIK